VAGFDYLHWLLMRLPCLLLTGFFSALALPAGHAAGMAAFSAPMMLHYGHVEVKGTLNGKPARLVLDTGAGVTVVTPEAARRFGLHLEKVDGVAEGVGGTVSIQSGGEVTVGVGRALLEKEPVFVVPVPEQLHGCDAIVGLSFFRRFVVTIDYENRRCGFGDDVEAVVAAVAAAGRQKLPAVAAVSLPMTIEHGMPGISALLDGQPMHLSIDTGDGSYATIYSQYVEKHHLRGRFAKRLDTVGGRGVGGVAQSEFVRVPSLMLGGDAKASGALTLRNVIGDLSQQKNGAFATSTSDGQIGGQILKRFVVTFDYERGRLLLTPNRQFREPFVFNRAGFGVDERGGQYIAASVDPGGPGAVAGIQEGDVLLSINGVAMPVIMEADDDAYPMMRKPVGMVLRVIRQRGASPPGEVDVTLRELL